MFQSVPAAEIKEQVVLGIDTGKFELKKAAENGIGQHGEEEIRQPRVMVDDSGVRECGDVGGIERGSGGVDGGSVAAVHREQVRVGSSQQDLQRDLQAESGGGEDGEDPHPQGGDESLVGAAIQERGCPSFASLPSQHRPGSFISHFLHTIYIFNLFLINHRLSYLSLFGVSN